MPTGVWVSREQWSRYPSPVGFRFEDLDDSQFERLVVQLMRKLFGIGVSGFAAGRDGGRDALFNGVAERFPSAQNPWKGITVGQAKHTLALNAHYADPDFSSDADSSVLSVEIERVKALVLDGELDNYFFVANRRLGGVIGPKLTKRIAKECGLSVDRVHLVGVEFLNDMLRQYPDLLNLARIDPVDGPLLVSSEDCAEVILAVSEALSVEHPTAEASVEERVSYDDKNELNNMSPDFAALLLEEYLPETNRFAAVLAHPENVEIKERYEAAVEEFRLKVTAKREHFQDFDSVFNHLAGTLFDRDSVLGRNASRKRLTRALLFYMYWHCDIGKKPDAVTQ